VQEAATVASFVLAHQVVTHNKAFSDADFVNNCKLAAVVLHTGSENKNEVIYL